MEWTDKVSAIASLISAIASCMALLGVFIAVQTYKDEIKERKIREYKSSVAAVESAAQKIDQAVKRKIEVEKKLEHDFDPFSYEHISNNYQIESEVFIILNAYESLCYQTLAELISKDAWFQVRGDAFLNTMNQYNAYIKRYITQTGSVDAWASCRKIAKLTHNNAN